MTLPSQAFEQFCKDHQIRHILNSTRHQQANGQAERRNRTIVLLFSTSSEDQRRWSTKVQDVESLLNTAEDKSTTKTPYEALHWYRPHFHTGAFGSLSLNTDERREPSVIQ